MGGGRESGTPLGLRALGDAEAVEARVGRLDWQAIAQDLDRLGYATTPALLSPSECRALRNAYTDPNLFRSRIEMARYRFGEGEYQYFAEPLPDLVASLRRLLYEPLAVIANRWSKALQQDAPYPDRLDEFLAICRSHGQGRPTPLLLRYETEGYNCLHQDLYGPVHFPLQVTCLLSEPGQDFQGGEFLLVEQRPRAQSRGHVVPLGQGACVVFPVRERPVPSKRCFARVQIRHGVSRLRSGQRMALGIIFHDAT
jgi:uncharacterized protein